MSALSIENLNVWFGTGAERTDAVRDVSLEVGWGESFGLVGESGSGKSTILRAVAGLVPTWSGRMTVADETLGKKRSKAFYRKVQMVFQDPYGSLHPRQTVDRVLSEAMHLHGVRDIDSRMGRLLDDVGLGAGFRFRFPHQLSGGQRQRVAIARALACEPQVLLLDEPTSALDVSVQAQVLNLMSDLREEYGLTYLFISHDLTVVQHMADVIGVLYLGRLVEEAPRDALFNTPKHPYTQMLFEAAPRMDGFGRDIDVPKGEIPDAINPPSGCAFHPRCPFAVERCRVERPEMRKLGRTRVACHLAE